jgi:O-antigen/teichoic acid export membrane protein
VNRWRGAGIAVPPSCPEWKCSRRQLLKADQGLGCQISAEVPRFMSPSQASASSAGKSLRARTVKNIGSAWFALLVSGTVGFLLSPLILHRLGDEAFGLWVLAYSFTSYSGLFDLGIRSSVIRFVARHAAKDNRREMERVIVTGFLSYCWIGLLVLGTTVLVSPHLGRLFHVAAPDRETVHELFLVVGLCIALNFPLGIFGAVLEGLQEFCQLNLIRVGVNLARGALIFAALEHGLGLLAVIAVTAAIPVVGSLCCMFAVHRLIGFRPRRGDFDRKTLTGMIGYGSSSFIIVVAERLRFESDALIVGTFLSASAVAFLGVGAKLADYAVTPVNGMAGIFTPIASEFDVHEDHGRLRSLLVQGNRLCAVVMFPICAALLILGKPLIEAWVGPQYLSSYPILVLFLVPKTLYRSQEASNRLLFGMARHRPLAWALLIEGAINVLLSIWLVHPFGIVGDAIGTALPLCAVSVFFLPWMICHVLDMPVGVFLRSAYLSPLLLSILPTAAWMSLEHFYPPHGYAQIFIQLVGGGVIYLAELAWLLMFREPAGIELRKRLAGMLR